MKSHTARSFVFVAGLLCFSPTCNLRLHAQTGTAQLAGLVTDSSGAVLPHASVFIVNSDTGVSRQVESDTQGHYTAPALQPGHYRVTVEAKGFQTLVTENVTLNVAQEANLGFQLKVGTEQQAVTVDGSSLTLNTTDGSISTVLDRHFVENMPLNGRTFAQLALLAPGTSKGEQANDFLNQGNASEVSFRGSVSLSVQGMSENSNDWRLDGIDNNELTAGGVAFLPEIDGIEEFSVLTFNYSAQYGSRGGSTVLVSTKAGTNNFHGSVFEFLRNDALDARNYFDGPTKGHYRQNEFGFSVGGPIIKNRTFFFGDYQGNRVRQGSPILSIVPTDAQKAGNFTGTHIFDPTTGASTRPEFLNDIIPQSEISSVGQAVVNLYASPNHPSSSGYNYLANPVKLLNDNPFDIRLDHQIIESDRVYARYSSDNANQFLPSGLPGFGARSTYSSTQTFTTHARNMMISETHLFSPRLINQVSGGYNRDFNYIRSFGFGSNEASKVGIPGVNLGDAATSGMTQIGISGYNPLGDRLYSPFQGGTGIFHYFDVLNWVRKSHTIALGFDIRAMQGNDLAQSAFAGSMRFNSKYSASYDPINGFDPATGSSIASLLLGYPESQSKSTQIGATTLGRRWKEFRGYVQDNWTVSPRLTLNLGLAYGVTTPLSEAANRYTNFDLNTGQFLVASAGGGSKVGVRTDYSNVEPRFGFSYNPFGGAPNTVIRGGYAIFHDVSQQGGSTGLQQNPPFVSTYGAAYDDITPGKSIANGFPIVTGPVDLSTYTGDLVATSRNFKQGLIQQYNINMQQALPGATVLTLAYAGTHGSRIIDIVANANAAGPGPIYNEASKRPFPKYNNITGIESNGWLSYNSLQAKLERRATRDLYLLLSYTYSQGLTNGYQSGVSGNPGTSYYPLVPYGNADRGLSPLSLRNNLTTSFIYSLPFGKGQPLMSGANAVEDVALGGWKINGIIVTHSGFPLAFTEALDNSGAGVSSRPIQSCANPVSSQPSVSQWLKVSCFSNSPTAQLGVASRTSGYGPRRTNVDFSVFKAFPVVREQNLEFRAEFFNLFNHSQFGTPDQTFGDSTFGVISSTVATNRQVQFALKYLF